MEFVGDFTSVEVRGVTAGLEVGLMTGFTAWSIASQGAFIGGRMSRSRQRRRVRVRTVATEDVLEVAEKGGRVIALDIGGI